jgi:hypothetical protein
MVIIFTLHTNTISAIRNTRCKRAKTFKPVAYKLEVSQAVKINLNFIQSKSYFLFGHYIFCKVRIS